MHDQKITFSAVQKQKNKLIAKKSFTFIMPKTLHYIFNPSKKEFGRLEVEKDGFSFSFIDFIYERGPKSKLLSNVDEIYQTLLALTKNLIRKKMFFSQERQLVCEGKEVDEITFYINSCRVTLKNPFSIKDITPITLLSLGSEEDLEKIRKVLKRFCKKWMSKIHSGKSLKGILCKEYKRYGSMGKEELIKLLKKFSNHGPEYERTINAVHTLSKKGSLIVYTELDEEDAPCKPKKLIFAYRFCKSQVQEIIEGMAEVCNYAKKNSLPVRIKV